MVEGRRRRGLHGLTGMLAVCLAVANGQHYERDPLRSVSGTVTDHSKEPLRGAVVELEKTDTLAIESYVTDERGTYHFRNLRPDADYTVWATFRGEHSKKESMSKFDHKADRIIHLEIRPGKD
jgi:protocatechuate 3,4-dioxygenase beta subunit